MNIRRELASITTAVVLFFGINQIWASTADVVWFETSLPESRSAGMVRLLITGWKTRDCTYIPDSQVGYMQTDTGVWEESQFKYINDYSPNSNTPSSVYRKRSFGIWEWRNYNYPSPKIVQVQATVGHDCGAQGIRTTVLGPFPAGAFDDSNPA